ncbi:MAG TPA: glycogen synthase GlgA, partial [Clostridia bacterium]|nr:glycogen synthase GlgA [Clostridia bacterium]
MTERAKKAKILFAASECAPFVKTGGLADVVGALPVALARHGYDVRVVLPLYKQIRRAYNDRMTHASDGSIRLGWREQFLGIEELKKNGVTYYFIDNEYYFARDYIYGVFNCYEAERFGFFSKAILELMARLDFYPDILHLNDWQTGMAAALLKTQYADKPGYARVKSLFTIHNLRFQGVFERGFVDELLSLGPIAFDPDALEYCGNVSYMKGGLAFADAINTVSPTYAAEIQTSFFGETLDGLLRARGGKLTGILNGIDTKEYDPAADKALPANFSAGSMEGKKLCKAALQQELCLAQDPGAPILAIVSRLTGQKGLDLVERVLFEMMEKPVQLAVLGTGGAHYEGFFNWVQKRFPGRAAARIEYNEGLARRIYAGADLFLMPSLFEPCGLAQLIAMRYGAIPIVRETGGLKDSVKGYNQCEDTGVGFSFPNYNAHELLYTVQRAVDYCRNDPAMWQRLVERAMGEDFSWKIRARDYERLYGQLTIGDGRIISAPT